jgi:hypothetical protein
VLSDRELRRGIGVVASAAALAPAVLGLASAAVIAPLVAAGVVGVLPARRRRRSWTDRPDRRPGER